MVLYVLGKVKRDLRHYVAGTCIILVGNLSSAAPASEVLSGGGCVFMGEGGGG